MPKIIFIISIVDNTIIVNLLAKTAFLIISEFTFKNGFIIVTNESWTMPEPIGENPFVVVPIAPEVLTLPIGLIPFKIAHNPIPIGKPIGPMALLVKIGKLSLISFPKLISKYSEPRNSAQFPFTKIWSKCSLALPKATPMFVIVGPLAIIYLSVGPYKSTFTTSFVLKKLSFVYGPIYECLSALAVL